MQASCSKEEAIKRIDKELERTVTFPCSPFLLISIEKDGSERRFVIETWDGMTIDIAKNGQFTQTFKWTAHKASEEEIEMFAKEREFYE